MRHQRHRRRHILKSLRVAGLAAMACLAAGCSSQQTYGVGQAWQRNQCYQLTQLEDRQRCLKEADRPYDRYQKDADSLGTGNKPAASSPAN